MAVVIIYFQISINLVIRLATPEMYHQHAKSHRPTGPNTDQDSPNTVQYSLNTVWGLLYR